MLNPANYVEGEVFLLFGKSAFDVAPDVLPANTVPAIVDGGAWGGAWRHAGFATPDGATLGGLSPDNTPQMTSQQRAATSIVKGNSTQTIGMTLLEWTVDNWRDAMGQGTIVSDAEMDELEFTDDPVRYLAAGIEGATAAGKLVRFIYPIVIAAITGDVTMTIGTNAGIPITLTRSGGAAANPRMRILK
jgi:hypothetical protein